MKCLGLMPLMSLGILVATTPSAQARNGGIASEGCDGCHRGGKVPVLTLAAEPLRPEPGGSAVITIRVPRLNGPTAGLFLTSHGTGRFEVIPGQGLKLIENGEVIHERPKSATGSEVVFQIRWRAPEMSGGAGLDVFAVAANGDGARTGDGAGRRRLSLAFGCEGIAAYRDDDGDGYGRDDPLGPTPACALGPGFAAQAGDCNDANMGIHPGAAEVCNFFDDDCDGEFDEGVTMVTVYRDADRDGHGARFTQDTRMYGCGESGYAAVADDCDDNDPSVHPGAIEICNQRDDNCNGRVDERARATCGEGWCRRAAPTCDPMTCQPGEPRPEVCNAFDDDCDGVIDNGSELCGEGELCLRGACLTPAEAADAGVPWSAPEAASGSGGTDGGPGGNRMGNVGSSGASPSRGCRFAPVRPSDGSGAGGIFLISALALLAACAGRPKVRAPAPSIEGAPALRFRTHVIDATPPKDPWFKMLGDVDGDGRPDPIIGGRHGPLRAYLGPDWRRRVEIAAGGYAGVDGEAADVNGDGRVDVIMGGMVWFENPGAPWDKPWTAHAIDDYRSHDVEVGDLDGDGRIDVLARDQSGFGSKRGNIVRLYFQDEGNAWTKLDVEAPHGEGLQIADLDRDGDRDIVIAGRWFENPGRQSARASSWPAHVYTQVWTWLDAKLAVADFTGDGRPDVALAPSEHARQRYRVALYEAPTDPRQGGWREQVLAPDAEAVVHAADATDFDLDGDVDLLTAEMHQGDDPDEVLLYLNQGAGRAFERQVLSERGSHNIEVADIDGDEDPDVLGANWSGPDQPVVIWENLRIRLSPSAPGR